MGRDGRSREVAALVGLLILLALGGWRVSHSLVPSLGVAVVGAALFLSPRATAFVGAFAIAVATAVAAASGWTTDMVIRVGNVTVATIFAVMAATFLDRRLRRAEALGREQAAILGSIPEAVMVLDQGGTLLRANPGLLRVAPGATLGSRVHPLLSHVLSDGSPCPGGCALDGASSRPNGNVPVEGEQIRIEGRLVPVAYTTGPMDAGATVVVLRDVSTRVRAEHDRRVLLQEAARTQERLHAIQALGGPGEAPLTPIRGLATDLWTTAAGVTGAGDLVDVSELPDRHVLLLMVDAAGDGLASLRDAWKVQYVARAHMMAGVTLSELVQHTAATLAGEGGGVEATVAALVVDLDTGHLQAVMGGHPPPLLVRGDGTTEWLEASGRGIGDAGAGSQSVLSATLGAGDTLVLYTDGVVDAGSDVIEGLSALRSTARALRLQPLPGLARRIGEATGGSAARTEQATVLAARLSAA